MLNMDQEHVLELAVETLREASDSNRLDSTVFYSCKATTEAVMAVAFCLQRIEKDLKEIKTHVAHLSRRRGARAAPTTARRFAQRPTAGRC